MQENHHYDLFARPDGWTAKHALIISPYVEPKFFRRLVDELHPASLTVVVDDGCRSDDVDMLRKLSSGDTCVVVALGSAPGLVHSKIFHTEWRTAKGNRAHSLVYGSGNATHQAFSGAFNSEVMCRLRLRANYHYDTIEWLEKVRSAAANPKNGIVIESLWTDLTKDVDFRLPKITIKGTASKASGFDLWLQRGYLLSAYKPDTGFLRVGVSLKRKLPPGELERRITAAGIEIPQTGSLSIPYIVVQEQLGEGGRWRSQLFTETDLGEWCSEACFDEKHSLFRKNGFEARQTGLQQLNAILSDNDLMNEIRTTYLRQIGTLWDVLGPSAGTYLKVKKQDHIVDVDHYASDFEDRLKRDAELAADNEFKSRYLNGFSVVPVPRFRLDTAAWATFKHYFIAQLHYDSLKQRVASLLFRRIKSVMGPASSRAFEPRRLEKFLADEWGAKAKNKGADGLTVGEYIDGYQSDKIDLADGR